MKISNPILIKKLIIVKLIFDQAEKQSNNHSVINWIMAIIGFDLTVETLVKIIISFLDPNTNLPDSFDGLLQKADKLLMENGLPELPSKINIRHVHSLRNDAQHKLKYPNPSDLDDCRIYVRDFCTEVIITNYELSFKDISPVDWIEDLQIQSLVKASHTSFSNNEFKKGIVLAKVAFNLASRCFINFIPSEEEELYSKQIPELSKMSVKYLSDSMVDYHKQAMRFSALLSSGIDLIDYFKFRQISPSLEKMNKKNDSDGNIQINIYWKNKIPNQRDANWLIGFVENAIIGWQFSGLEPKYSGSESDLFLVTLLNWDESKIHMFD